jgi:hypothetical protein
MTRARRVSADVAELGVEQIPRQVAELIKMKQKRDWEWHESD